MLGDRGKRAKSVEAVGAAILGLGVSLRSKMTQECVARLEGLGTSYHGTVELASILAAVPGDVEVGMVGIVNTQEIMSSSGVGRSGLLKLLLSRSLGCRSLGEQVLPFVPVALSDVLLVASLRTRAGGGETWKLLLLDRKRTSRISSDPAGGRGGLGVCRWHEVRIIALERFFGGCHKSIGELHLLLPGTLNQLVVEACTFILDMGYETTNSNEGSLSAS